MMLKVALAFATVLTLWSDSHIGRRQVEDPYVAAGRLLDAGKFAQAAAIYEDLLTRDFEMTADKRARILNNLGFSHFLMKKTELALRRYSEALTLAPTYATCLNNMGAALMGQERFSEALPYLERAYRSERSIKIVFNLFVVHYRLGHEREALAFIEEAMKLNTTYTETRLKAKNVKQADIERLKKRIKGFP